MKGRWKFVAPLLVLALGIAMLGAGGASAAGSRKGGSSGLRVRITGKSQTGILHRGVFVKVHSSRPRRLRLSGTSVTYDAGSKQLTKKVVVRFRRAGTRTVRLPLLRSVKKNVRSCTARTIRVHAGGAKSQVEMNRTLGSCRLPSIDMSERGKLRLHRQPGNALCMLPFPDDYYTRRDPTSATGRRIDFKTEGMPANVYGQHIEAAPYNASDGFSPGSVILVKIPGIESAADVAAMGATPINHLGQLHRTNAPVVVIDAQTGKRWPIWTEIDSTANDPSKATARDPPGGQLHLRPPLHRRPAQPQERGRQEARSAGRLPLLPRRSSVQTGPDQRPAPAASKSIFSKLKKAGIHRGKPLPGLGLHRRQRQEQRPPRALDAKQRLRPARRHQPRRRHSAGRLADLPRDERRKRTRPGPDRTPRQGHVRRPLLPVPELRARRHVAARTRTKRPIQNGTWTANFDCIIPDSAAPAPAGGAAVALRARPLRRRLRGRLVAAADLSEAHDIVQCATDEIGMSESDHAGDDRGR